MIRKGVLLTVALLLLVGCAEEGDDGYSDPFDTVPATYEEPNVISGEDGTEIDMPYAPNVGHQCLGLIGIYSSDAALAVLPNDPNCVDE